MPGEILKNYTNNIVNEFDIKVLRDMFPKLGDDVNTPILSLRRYSSTIPERFFSNEIYVVVKKWLEEHALNSKIMLKQYLAENSHELSKAFYFLKQINADNWHDEGIQTFTDDEIFIFLERKLHPAYLQLSEGVLKHLLKPFAYFSRVLRDAKTDSLDLYNIIVEVEQTPLKKCCMSYRHIIRNGIGHGGITYARNSVRYSDKKGNEEQFELSFIIRIVDDLVDTCNALSLAYKVFFLEKINSGYCPPHFFMIEALSEVMCSFYWSIDNCIQSEFDDKSQLLIYSQSKTRDAEKIRMFSIQTLVWAELLAPGYGRYFVHIKEKKKGPGWAYIDGDKLKQARINGAFEFSDYASVAGDFNFYFHSGFRLPRLVRKIVNIIQVFRRHWLFIKLLQNNGLGLKKISVRTTEVHRQGIKYVLMGSVVLEENEIENCVSFIRVNRKKIFKECKKEIFSKLPFWDINRFLPIGYLKVSVFSKDFRKRRLSSFGVADELICQIQIKKSKSIKVIGFIGSTIEKINNWYIAWNEVWLGSGYKT